MLFNFRCISSLIVSVYSALHVTFHVPYQYTKVGHFSGSFQWCSSHAMPTQLDEVVANFVNNHRPLTSDIVLFIYDIYDIEEKQIS